MLPVVLPLRMIAFQCLFLLLAIAVEAWVFYRNLEITPRKSVEYAASINFLSTVVGWLVFLSLQTLLPAPLQLALMNYILFDQWSGDTLTLLVVTAMVTFFVSLLIKLFGLIALQRFLGDQLEPKKDTPVKAEKESMLKTDKSDEKSSENLKTKSAFASRSWRETRQPNRQGNAVLLANALSYSTILLVLILRLLAQGTLDSVIS